MRRTSSNRLKNPKATSNIGGWKRNEKSMDSIGSAGDNSGRQNATGASAREQNATGASAREQCTTGASAREQRAASASEKRPNSGRAYRLRPPAGDALRRPDHQQPDRAVCGWISGWNHRQGKRPHRLRPRTGPTDQYSGATATYSHGSSRPYL